MGYIEGSSRSSNAIVDEILDIDKTVVGGMFGIAIEHANLGRAEGITGCGVGTLHLLASP